MADATNTTTPPTPPPPAPRKRRTCKKPTVDAMEWPALPGKSPFILTEEEVGKACRRFGSICVADRMTLSLLRFTPQKLVSIIRDAGEDLGGTIFDSIKEAREEAERTLEIIKCAEARLLVAAYQATTD